METVLSAGQSGSDAPCENNLLEQDRTGWNIILIMGLRTAPSLLLLLALLPELGQAHQGSGQDDKILERGEKLLDEAKDAYEEARTKTSVAAFVDAGFRLEEARIKFIVLQEIGSPDKQKIATDRLRAINQLGKLIHDGKVAISGAPEDSSTPGRVEPPPDPQKKDSSPAPPPIPAPPAVDVTKRSPIPDAARQHEAEKVVKDLFKEQYGKKTPADRRALGLQLLEQAAKSQDDPSAQWVLLREAQDSAVQAAEVKLAFQAIELSAQVFDVDPLPLKNAAITAIGKSAKMPAENAALAEASRALIDELVRADQYDPADKAAAAAVQFARKSNDPSILFRATVRSKEIAEAKTMYQGLRSALETLAKSPDDPAANSEMGKYLCFVKGSWDLGLRFLVKGSDLTLRTLAEKESTLPHSSADWMSLADSWSDLVDKEKSPLRKSQLAAHARTVYQSALAEAPALTRVRIEKRLEALQNADASQPPLPLDVTKLTPKRATVGYGTFEVNVNRNNARVVVKGKECKLYLFAHAPSTVVYDIPAGSKSFLAVGAKLDRNAPQVAGTWKYLVVVDGKNVYESPALNEVKDWEIDISIPLPPGAKEIQLKVDDLGDVTCDWAIWAYPRFQK